MAFDWRSVPDALLGPLLQGSVGKMQLHTLANAALDLLARNEACPTFPLADFVREVSLAAWEEAPLDLTCMCALLDLQDSWPCLPASFVRLLQTCKAGQHVPDDISQLRELARSGDDDGMLALTAERHEAEPGNAYWLQQAVRLGSARDLPWLEQRLARARGVPEPILDALKADVALLRGDHGLAVRRYTAAMRALPLPGWRARLGESLLRAGQTDEALRHWQTAHAQRPWQVHLLLRCDDLRRGRHLPAALPLGRGVILLYSWNKAPFLDATLASLHASEIGAADIIVLDNGSNDETPAVLEGWARRFAPRLETVRLPCNIGAPAARNWLLSLPQIRDYDWLVFLDDDITLPPDWLRYFGAAMLAHPGNGVFGCRAVDQDRPHMIQCADFHLTPGDRPDKKPGSLPDFVQRFSVSTLHLHATQDFGQFTYMRPCASVTGCCHLFRRDALFETGAFDLRCSPSPFDDFEHDLRHVLRGDMPIYQGYLRIPHLRRTGSYGAGEDPQLANAWANMYKLQMSRPREDFDRIRDAGRAALLEDVLARTDAWKEEAHAL
ncbi:MAG: glycosyltransferase [Deltaproteobacteria bacterium]|jgi:GT2 family glycosyltransferase|nr:glycosyltransferase [Deltaproteobacteria bacterium]